MRLLFIGDIVGPPGVEFLRKYLPTVIDRERLDIVVANAENASSGSGITPNLYRQLRAAGVDLMTLGDHIYRRAEIISLLTTEERVCKPANFPPEAPGRCAIRAQARDGTQVAVVSLVGRTFMKPIDCPFRAADRVLAELSDCKVIVVDMHAEATGEKYLMAHHLKGRVSAVLGTHTHIATADEQIFPEGTAFQRDVGMTGPYESILGRRIDRALSTTLSFVPSPFDVATEDVRLAGAIVEIDPQTGRATAICRTMIREKDLTG